MILFGLVIMIGACAAAGPPFFARTISIYENFAFSYARQAAFSINGDDIYRYLATGRKDEQYEQTLSYLSQIADSANIRYYYVVVPTEKDLIYIWEAHDQDGVYSSEAEMPADLLEHGEYTEGEKERMMEVLRGTGEMDLFVDFDYGKEMLGTALYPIYDSQGRVAAVAGVDLDLIKIVLNILRLYRYIVLAILVVLLAGIAFYFHSVRIRVIKPIVALKKATVDLVNNLSTGKEFRLDVHTGDEIEVLARSFERMDLAVKRYIEDNTQITAEKERIITELNLATRIQEGMLPNCFPPFPDRKEFDIYASMDPAKEVGGDFYDFFFTDNDHLAIVIADVSGKGIPAALFMMMSMIMIQNYTKTGLSPGKVLETVNQQICSSNREEMFVTVWLGILDLVTGTITAVNAGHEFPAFCRSGGPFSLIRDQHGFVVGGMEGVHYREYEMKMEPGDKLFVYTDGLPEATNSEDEMFGTDRMLEVLNGICEGQPEDILRAERRAVDLFAKNVPQFDDLTMLCLTYHGQSI